VVNRLFIAVLFAAGLALAPRPVAAQTLGPQERLCDPTFQDCRADILTYIQQETVEIDMGFWMMTDARYANALVAAWQRGVKIRLLMDPGCVTAHEACGPQNDQLAGAGIPMRNRTASGILHWKCIIFAGQGQMEFAGANYAPFELTPDTPWVNFTDEIVMFTNNASILHSFMRKFDDLWTSTSEFSNYANVSGPLTRSYPTYSIDPQLNFPPDDSYRTRSTNAYAAETQGIDALMFRITDEQQSDGIIAALNRGVPVRLITDETEYRNASRLWDAYNVDKMYHAGVQVRVDDHQGINHAKGIILKSQGMSIYGSSNWTSPSTDSQREHNMFTTQAWIFTWMQNLFNRKWNNSGQGTETKAFVPLPPDVPVYNSPANGATGVSTSTAMLSWDAGLWAHNYDIYLGTDPNPPLIASNVHLGPSQSSGDYRTYDPPTLIPGTRYYWKIVSKTMAFVPADGPVWSFTTAGTAPNNLPPNVSLTSPANGATFTAPASVTVSATASDSDGTVTKVDFYAGNTLLGTDTASPYSFTWSNVAAGNYVITAVATDNNGATTTSNAASIAVTGGGGSTLPAGWTDADVGAVGAAGSASWTTGANGGTYSVTGAGADVWGTTDALHYAYKPLTGDGSIVARVASIQNVNAWTKAGVMMRNSLSPSAAQAFMLVAASSAKGTPFQRRVSDGNTSVSTSGAFVTAPYWVKLVRSGNLITASESADGTNWTVVASDNFTMGSTILVGLAVSSHVAGTPATATFDNVTIGGSNPPPPNNPPSVSLTSPANGTTLTAPATVSIAANASDSDGTIAKVDFYAGGTLLGTDTASPYSFTWSNVAAGSYVITAVATDNGGATTTSGAVSITVNGQSSTLPSGWTNGDIGATGAAGSSTYNSGTGIFTVTGAGADVWGTADALQYAYKQMSGNFTIVARVTTMDFVNNWTKAGVMIRDSVSPSAAQAFMLVAASPTKGVAFQRRRTAGDVSFSTAGTQSTAPHWVKLVRSGNTISGYESIDGVAWTLVGSDTFVMGTNVLVGLGVSSHVAGTNATCTFDHVTVQ